MAKIRSLSDLRKMKEELRYKVSLRENSDNPESVVQVKVGMGASGIKSGAKEIYYYFIDQLEKRNIPSIVYQTGCIEQSLPEPSVEIRLPGKSPVFMGGLDELKVTKIIEEYIRYGEIVDGILTITTEKVKKTVKNK